MLPSSVPSQYLLLVFIKIRVLKISTYVYVLQKKADKVAKPDNDQEDLARYLKAKKKASNQKAVASAMKQVEPPTEGQAKASTSNDHAIASDKLSVGLNSTHEADVLFRGNLHSRGTQTVSTHSVGFHI